MSAMLCFMGHTLMENRNGLIVKGYLTQTDDHAERKAALDMIHRHSPGSTRRLTLGADYGRQQPCPATTVARGMKKKMDPGQNPGSANRHDTSVEPDRMTGKRSGSETISAAC